jgi:hypothetical protein
MDYSLLLIFFKKSLWSSTENANHNNHLLDDEESNPRPLNPIRSQEQSTSQEKQRMYARAMGSGNLG